MTIEKGKEWGHPAVTPRNCVIVASDAELGLSARDVPVVVSGGDLFEALGRPLQREAGEECVLVQIDALRCIITHSSGETSERLGSSYVSFGHYIHGEFTLVSNSGFWKRRHIAPRSHPNDGQFDLVRFSPDMSVRQRCIAFNKMKTSTHLPHPHISSRREIEITVRKASRNWPCVIDGEQVGDWHTVTVTVVPDFWTVIL